MRQPPVVTILVARAVPCRVRTQSAIAACAQALSCQLCRDPAVPCHDTNSMLRPKLSHDLEYQVATWEPPPMTKLCRDNEPFYKSVATENPCRAPTSCRDNPGRACSALLSAHPERCRRVCPSPVVPTLS